MDAQCWGGRDGHSWSLEGEAQDDLSKLAELGLQLHALLTGEREAASQVHSPPVHFVILGLDMKSGQGTVQQKACTSRCLW